MPVLIEWEQSYLVFRFERALLTRLAQVQFGHKAHLFEKVSYYNTLVLTNDL